jgi:hypothetical protein
MVYLAFYLPTKYNIQYHVSKNYFIHFIAFVWFIPGPTKDKFPICFEE